MAHYHPTAGKLGDILRKLREDKGISQEKLAFASDLDRTYIGRIEREDRSPTFHAVGAIIDALGISWTDLGQALDHEQRRQKRNR